MSVYEIAQLKFSVEIFLIIEIQPAKCNTSSIKKIAEENHPLLGAINVPDHAAWVADMGDEQLALGLDRYNLAGAYGRWQDWQVAMVMPESVFPLIPSFFHLLSLCEILPQQARVDFTREKKKEKQGFVGPW